MSGADASEQVWLIQLGWNGGSAWLYSATEPALEGDDLNWTPIPGEHVARIDFSMCHLIKWKLKEAKDAKPARVTKLPTADVMAAIEHEPGMTFAKLARMVGGRQRPIMEAITRLIDEGVVRCDTGRGGVNRFWPAAIERSGSGEQPQPLVVPSWVED